MNAVLNILRGIVIGIANVIPGVSGGTMAVSMGIYDKLISSVTGLFKHFKQSMKLLIPLGIGMIIGIVGFGFLLEYLLANHVLATCLTFVGLILGGLPILWLSLKSNLKKTPGRRIGAGEVISFLVLGDGFLLEVVAKRPVAQHLEHGESTGSCCSPSFPKVRVF